ncbi:MAG: hypothetical protein JSU04_07755 [Bdellovibrionales bacterium]|nr:hypothetical protein [Bdellovibrionales bacterium]
MGRRYLAQPASLAPWRYVADSLTRLDAHHRVVGWLPGLVLQALQPHIAAMSHAAGPTGPPYTDWVNLGRHESGHTYQYQAPGPFFLPAYLLSGGAFTSKNPFETAADNYGKTGKGWWPW